MLPQALVRPETHVSEPDEVTEITRLLNEAQGGREQALDDVMELVYRRLRAIAASQLRRRAALAGELSLQPTDLVHEAFLRLIKQRKQYDNRGQFFAIASRVMMRVLVDEYRARAREKRGGDALRVTLTDYRLGGEGPVELSFLVPAFVECLERLRELDARTAEVAQLRLLWGLTMEEIASTIEVSLSTVEREWRFGRGWLASRLGDDAQAPPSR